MIRPAFVAFCLALTNPSADLRAQPARPEPSAPPRAAQIPFEVKSPQGSRVDEYYWLRDDDPKAKRPEILDYLKAERAYTEAYMAPLRPLKEKLLAEMQARIKPDDSTAPYYDNGYWYWRRFDPGAEYPVFVRRRGSPSAMAADAAEEILLDVPKLASGNAFYQVGSFAVSPDNRWLAFVEDTQGRRINTLRFRDLQTGEFLPQSIPGVLEALVWAADSRTLFYIRQDPQTLQSGPVYRHVLGTDPECDVLVFDEPDKTLFTRVQRSASRQYVMIVVGGYETTETLVIPSGDPLAAPRVVLPRRDGVRSYADHLGGRWVIRTNDSARNFRLVETGADPADRSQWQDLVAHRSTAAVDDFALFNGAIAVQERVDGNPRLRVLPWGAAPARATELTVPADEPAFAMELGGNPDPAAAFVRYTYASLVTPSTVFDIDPKTGERFERKVDEVPTYDRAKYRTERLWAPARDGKRIPVSIVYRADRFRRDGSAPLLLTGYGAYGYAYDTYLHRNVVSLLDRGFAFAIAHVRGGSELGQDWYEDGRLLHKKNTFNDFVDATDFLVRGRYAARDKVFAQGGSAGGLLMGVIANEAGDRYRGIALDVPFVDAVTTMLDETIPLTANEWTQWGDPRQPGFYQYMLSYSPYDNIGRKPYPALLVSTGLWDSQVQYFEPAKYVARLRARKTDGNPLLFDINLEAGHSGRSGRFAALEERALQYAFFLSLAGITE
jgi:oligopeptidase B